jgi:hypothetical protein
VWAEGLFAVLLSSLTVPVILHPCCFRGRRQHYYQQMRKEADKQWPSKNKKLDWVLALAHGT